MDRTLSGGGRDDPADVDFGVFERCQPGQFDGHIGVGVVLEIVDP